MSIEIEVSGDLRALGLTFRRFRGTPDCAIMVGIMNACNEVDGLTYNESAEDIAHVFEHLPHCDPIRDVLFAEIDGDPVACTRALWKDEQEGPRLYVSLRFVAPSSSASSIGSLSSLIRLRAPGLSALEQRLRQSPQAIAPSPATCNLLKPSSHWETRLRPNPKGGPPQ